MSFTYRHAPKFVSIGYFCGHLVTIALLIEIYHMVPFVLIVSHMVSVYSRGPQTAPPCQWGWRLERKSRLSIPTRTVPTVRCARYARRESHVPCMSQHYLYTHRVSHWKLVLYCIRTVGERWLVGTGL